MPEGDTIHRTAINLRKVLDDALIIEAAGRWEVPDAAELAGRRVVGIEARGKHLMMHVEGQLVLHSHMGMTGSWHIYRPTDRWQKPERQAAIVLRVGELQESERDSIQDHVKWCVVCFNPKLIELITATELRRNSYLQRLGPDLLGPDVDMAAVVARFRSQGESSIGEAVMNQTVVSGIGNVYKSEVLFLESIHPLIPVAGLSDAQLEAITVRAIGLMKRNLENRPRRTRFRPSGTRLWVYDRRNQPCLRCGTTIDLIRQGTLARSTYFCPGCQLLRSGVDG
jgi:endonuclease-8